MLFRSQQTLLSAVNATGLYQEYTNTIKLASVANTSISDDGYADIIISLPISGAAVGITSIQVVGLPSDEEGVAFEQAPANRQTDRLFNYYNPLLAYKNVPSYLVGWDFPMNPAQFGEAFEIGRASCRERV